MTEHERHPHDLTIAEAGTALRDGSLTCGALTDSVLERLEQTEPLLNAYITGDSRPGARAGGAAR